MIDAVFDAGVICAFVAGAMCACGEKCELTIALCIENVGVVSA